MGTDAIAENLAELQRTCDFEFFVWFKSCGSTGHKGLLSYRASFCTITGAIKNNKKSENQFKLQVGDKADRFTSVIFLLSLALLPSI